MDKIEKAIENSALYKIFGAEGLQELRDRLIEAVVDEVKDQLAESGDYIVDPDDIAESLYDEIKDAVIREVKDELKARVVEHFNKKFDLMEVSNESVDAY